MIRFYHALEEQSSTICSFAPYHASFSLIYKNPGLFVFWNQLEEEVADVFFSGRILMSRINISPLCTTKWFSAVRVRIKDGTQSQNDCRLQLTVVTYNNNIVNVTVERAAEAPLKPFSPFVLPYSNSYWTGLIRVRAARLHGKLTN